MLYLPKRKTIILSAVSLSVLACTAIITLSGITSIPLAKALSITSVYVDKGSVDGGTEVTLNGDFAVSGPRVVQVATGYTSSCALDTDGKAYCWGNNGYGQLGNGTTTDSPVPIAVDTSGVLAGKTLAQLAAGGYNNCALDTDGKAYCWGYNYMGELGNGGGATTIPVPVAVDTSGVLAGKILTQLSAGGFYSCALDTDGKAYCWGQNSGLLGNGTTASSPVPVAVDTSGVLAGKALTRISVGGNNACALDSDGKAYCWGDNGYGQLGNGTTTDSSVPVAVDITGALSGKILTQITVGTWYSCALDTDGKAYCWGSNNYGQFGNGTTTDSSVPVAVDISGMLTGRTLTQISAGGWDSCALDTDGKAYCWGWNYMGELGNGGGATTIPVPVAVDTSGVLAGKTLIQISATQYNTCALDAGGGTYCWGLNSHGQLGDNTTTDSSVPVRVHTILDITDTPTASALPAPIDPPTYVVMFDVGGTPAECTNVRVATDGKSLTCTTSAHIAGAVDVTVDDGVGIFTLAGAFEYVNVGVPNTGVE